ncbi:MAG: PorV/PorQ family protein [Candidatus Poribacteria bacterium]
MKRINILALFFAMIILMPSAVLAGPGRTGAQILNLGGGTRAAALGDAFSTTTGDVTTAFWNPSGLATMPQKESGEKEKQAAISYTDYSQLFGEASDGLYYAFFAGALPLEGGGTLGTTLQIQGQGTILVTTDSPEPIREENLGTNWAWTVSYADRLADRLSAGISGKIIQMKLGPESGRAFAVDLGLQYDLPSVPIPITIGAAVQNWGTRIKFKDENQSDPLPRVFRLGTAATLYHDHNHRIRIVGELTSFIDKLKEDDDEGIDAFLAENPGVTRGDLLSDRGVGIHAFEWKNMQKGVGVEYWLANLLALRVGYKDDPGINLPDLADHITYGLGVRLLNYQFDYALIPGGGPDNKRLNVFALILKF